VRSTAHPRVAALPEPEPEPDALSA
jgi:hypothetical protein